MPEDSYRQEIIDTGLRLLKTGLVARTWGNVSAKIDEGHVLITPSGLDYTRIEPEDIALINTSDGSYTGRHKPSSEKGVHLGAYELLKDAGFVIHTHQTYATAFGVYGADKLDITDEELERLGGLECAMYGLPGSDKLTNAVRSAYAKGAHTVLMKHHGVVIAGKDLDEAFKRVMLLEDICKRNYKGHDLNESASLAYSRLNRPLPAQLDDMAQMIGRKIPVVHGDKEEALKHHNAILVPGEGAFVKGSDEDDTEALKMLAEKAAVTALHLIHYNVRANLSLFDTLYMNYNYKKNYSKQKNQQ